MTINNDNDSDNYNYSDNDNNNSNNNNNNNNNNNINNHNKFFFIYLRWFLEGINNIQYKSFVLPESCDLYLISICIMSVTK